MNTEFLPVHELTLCKNILDIANHHLIGKKAERINKICLEVGLLTCVDIPALRFGFEAACQGTVAANAILEIITVPGQAQCTECNLLMDIEHHYDPCPICGQISLTVIRGEALRLKYMEIE